MRVGRPVHLSCLGFVFVVIAVSAADRLAVAQDAKPGAAAAAAARKQPLPNAKLKEWLPAEIGGLKQTSTSGSELAVEGMTYSLASGQYGDPAAGTTASVSVTDYAGSPESAASLAAFKEQQIDEQGPGGGYQKTTTIDGFPAMEMYDGQHKMGMLTIYVGDRFFLQASTNGLDKATFQKARDSLGLKKLAALAGGDPAGATTAPTTRPAGGSR